MDKTKLSPPWEEYVKKLHIIFGEDEDVNVECTDTGVVIRVDNTDKYNALVNLLPTEKKFGNVTLLISIIPANPQKTTKDFIKDLFKGNKAVTDIQELPVGTNSMTFVEFEKEVIQYYNDNLGDLHGNRTTVMEQIAREIFEDVSGVYFCTSNDESW